MKGGRGPGGPGTILLGEVKAEFRIGDPEADNAGGGDRRAEPGGGKLDGGTGAVGIIGIEGIVVEVIPWFMSRNFRAFKTSSLLSDFLRFLGVDVPELPGSAGLAFFDSALGRLRDFFLVEVGWAG